MAPAVGGDDGGGSGWLSIPHGVDRNADNGGKKSHAAASQNLGGESGSRKRKAAVMSKGSASLVGNGEYLEVAREDSWRIKKEIEDLRSQLDEEVKKLGYCEENERLRVGLALTMKELQCLSKQNEEMQAKDDSMTKWNEELEVTNDGLVKQNEELQSSNDEMRPWNEELQTKSDVLSKQNEELTAKNFDLVKRNDELQTSIDSMKKQNKELHVRNGGLRKQNEELGSKNDGQKKQNKELQGKNDGLVKQNQELQLKHVCLMKQNLDLQTNNDGMRNWNGQLQAKIGGLTKRSEELKANNEGLMKQNKELQAKNDALRKKNEKLQAENDGSARHFEEVEAKNDGLRKCTEELEAKNDGLLKLIENLQAKNEGLTNRNEEVQDNYDGLKMRSEELQAKNDSLMKQNAELQAKNDGMMKWNEELQAKNDGLHKNIMEVLEIQIDAKRKHLMQFLRLYRTINSPISHLKLSDKDSNSELVRASVTEKSGSDSKIEDKLKHLGLEVVTLDGEVQCKMEKLSELLEHEISSEGLDSGTVCKSIQMNMELQDTQRKSIVGELDGCTDIGAETSWDIILDSIQRLKQAEPTIRQAASSFKEVCRPQAQVTKLDAPVNQKMANNQTLVETNAALKEEVAAYAAELEHTQKINEMLEAEKASVEQLMAMMQQALPPILKEFDVKIPVQEGVSLKSRIQRLEQISAKLKELPGVIQRMTLERVKDSAAHFGSLVLAILKSQLPTLDLSVINQGFRGTEKEAEDLTESLKHLVEPLSRMIEYESSWEMTMHYPLV